MPGRLRFSCGALLSSSMYLRGRKTRGRSGFKKSRMQKGRSCLACCQDGYYINDRALEGGGSDGCHLLVTLSHQARRISRVPLSRVVPSNSTRGMPGSRLAGETLYQRLQTSQPTERAAVKNSIGDILGDILRSLDFAEGYTFDVQLSGVAKSAKGGGITW